MPNSPPIYRSRPRLRNLFQEYRLYPDRLELPCHSLPHTFRVPLEEIAEIGLAAPMSGGRGWAIKPDLSDLFPHLYLVRLGHRSGRR